MMRFGGRSRTSTVHQLTRQRMPRPHGVLRDGLIAGSLGGTSMALWFLIVFDHALGGTE
jgi:hypothetical protein